MYSQEEQLGQENWWEFKQLTRPSAVTESLIPPLNIDTQVTVPDAHWFIDATPPPQTEDVKYEYLRSTRPSSAWGPILRALWHHLLGGRRSATQSCLTLRRHGLLPARLLFGLFLGEKPGVACHFLQQGIFLTQRLSLCLRRLLHWQVDSLPLSCRENPVRYPQPIRAPCVTINQSEPRALPSTNQSPVCRRQPIRESGRADHTPSSSLPSPCLWKIASLKPTGSLGFLSMHLAQVPYQAPYLMLRSPSPHSGVSRVALPHFRKRTRVWFPTPKWESPDMLLPWHVILGARNVALHARKNRKKQADRCRLLGGRVGGLTRKLAQEAGLAWLRDEWSPPRRPRARILEIC